MKIICAGFPKTGTKSMANALRELGYTVHDFEEHLEYNLDNYLDFFEARRDSTFLMEQYRDVDVVIDQPACTLWQTFFKFYPDCKVILMERENAEVWYKSYTNMMVYYLENHAVWFEHQIAWFSPTRAKFDLLSRHNMVRSAGSPYAFQLDDKWNKELWMAQYTQHNAAVKQLVPADQLLVYQVGEGWDRLCKFLGKAVPDHPFPRENVSGQKGNIADQMIEFTVFKRMQQEFIRNLLLTGVGITAAIVGGVVLGKKYLK